jgi:hypothetical protein
VRLLNLRATNYWPVGYLTSTSASFSLFFRGCVSPNERAVWLRMVRDWKEAFFACYWKLSWNSPGVTGRPAVTQVTQSTAKPAVCRPQIGVEVLHKNALCPVADSMHNTALFLWQMLHIRRFSFQILGVICSFSLSKSLKTDARRSLRDTPLLKTSS